MKKTLEVVDMFCGAGGESTGIMLAAQERGIPMNLIAINHWERAIETHAANHPAAEHLCESVEHIDPRKAVPGQRLDLLWASPECTHHSIARAGRPRSDQSRASAWMILKWLSELYVERVIIENVPEFTSWGPLDATGNPIQSGKSTIFKSFIFALQCLGYVVDWKILTAADYGDPTTRRRLFIQAARGQKKIIWPQITHIDGKENLMGYQPWKSARDIIDWSISGTSIFDRKRPLAEATMNRIAVGIKKYWGVHAEPFLAILREKGTAHSINAPISTISCSGAHHLLIEPIPFLLGQQSGATPRTIKNPVPTIATSGAISIVEPLITIKDWFALAKPFVSNPAKLDIQFRMLKPHELARAQGFPENYRILGTAAEQARQIGNAVPVNTAKALVLAALLGEDYKESYNELK